MTNELQKSDDILTLLEKWRLEVAGLRFEAEEARKRHFDVFPDDSPGRPPTGDWLFWSDKADSLQSRIDELEVALSATIPNRSRPGNFEDFNSGADSRKMKLQGTVNEMRKIVDRFYFQAIGVGNHPFIEWTGLMHEYVSICQLALNEGIDFTSCHIHSEEALPLHPVNIDYLAEKVRCIFGRSINAHPDEFQTFVKLVAEADTEV